MKVASTYTQMEATQRAHAIVETSMLLDVKQKLKVHNQSVDKQINAFWPYGKAAAALDFVAKTFRSQHKGTQGMVRVSQLSDLIKKTSDE